MKAALAILLLGASLANGQDGTLVRVHLPREVTVENRPLSLGALAVVRSENVAAQTKASAVAMGRAPRPGETITIDRTTILSRLASEGFDARAAQLSGAETISVTIRQTVLSSADLVRTADQFLDKNPPVADGGQWKLAKAPESLALEAKSPVLRPAVLPAAAPGYVRVRIDVVVDDKTVATPETLYKIEYPHRQVVAAKDIPAGGALSEENTRVETVMSDRKGGAELALTPGLRAGREIKAGTVVTAALTQTPAASREVAVKNNETVVMRIVRPGFTVSTLGQALQDGRVGDAIKVRNNDSKRVVIARVAPDGKVEPMIEENKP